MVNARSCETGTIRQASKVKRRHLDILTTSIVPLGVTKQYPKSGFLVHFDPINT
jgi:hypothetical protein